MNRNKRKHNRLQIRKPRALGHRAHGEGATVPFGAARDRANHRGSKQKSAPRTSMLAQLELMARKAVMGKSHNVSSAAELKVIELPAANT